MSVVANSLEALLKGGKKIVSNVSVDGGFKGILDNMAIKERDSIRMAMNTMKKAAVNGVGEGMSDLSNQRKALNNIVNKKGFRATFNAMAENRESMARQAKNITSGGGLGGAVKAYSANDIEKGMQVLNNGLKAGKSSASFATKAGLAKDMAMEYYRGGTKAQNITRGLVTYAGVNAAGRAISGGSLTRNNKGERDIAGIPMF